MFVACTFLCNKFECSQSFQLRIGAWNIPSFPGDLKRREAAKSLYKGSTKSYMTNTIYQYNNIHIQIMDHTYCSSLHNINFEDQHKRLLNSLQSSYFGWRDILYARHLLQILSQGRRVNNLTFQGMAYQNKVENLQVRYLLYHCYSRSNSHLLEHKVYWHVIRKVPKQALFHVGLLCFLEFR